MKRLLTLALTALLATGPATAAFYVDEEAPPQTAVFAQPTSSLSSFEITFYAKRVWLSQEARRALAERLAALRAAEEICIVVGTRPPNSLLLAKQRADSVKQWMADNGVPVAKVTIVDDSEVRARDQAGIVSVAMTVRNAPPPVVVVPSRTALARLTRVSVSAPAALTVQPAPALITDQTKIALLHRIVAMGKNKLVKVEDAFALVAEVLSMQDPAPVPAAVAPTVVLSPAPIPSPVLATLVAEDVPRHWALDDTKTLRANLEDWTRIAGWESPVWLVPDQYRVGKATVPGTFFDAMNQLAAAVPSLDFVINKTQRTLRVAAHESAVRSADVLSPATSRQGLPQAIR